jgi:hypothetical protein
MHPGRPIISKVHNPGVRAGGFGETLQMSEIQDGLPRTAAKLHHGMKETADAVGILLVDGFHYLALFAIGATTVWSALAAFISMLAMGALNSRTSFFCLSILKSAQWSESISRRPGFRFAT